jgi:hypothetical protein
MVGDATSCASLSICVEGEHAVYSNHRRSGRPDGWIGCAPLFFLQRERGVAMVREPDRELFLAGPSRREVSETRRIELFLAGPSRREGSETRRIIYCLINRLSKFLETKHEVNRAVDEIRLLLRRRVGQKRKAKGRQLGAGKDS